MHSMKWSLFMLSVIFVLLFTADVAFAENGSLIKANVRVGFIQSAFSGVNYNDARTAFKAFAKIVGRKKGYDVEITVRTFADAIEVKSLPEEMRPHLVILETMTFLELENEAWLKPVVVPSERDSVYNSFLILVPESSKAKTIRDLRGKGLNLLFTSNTEVGYHWLRSLLRENKLGEINSFFGDVKTVSDPMQAILPVFFGKRDVGLIDLAKFELMAELNPQLKKLRPIAISQPFLCAIISVNESGWDSLKLKQEFIASMLELHLSPAGQQILTLFKVDQLAVFRPEYLDIVRTLFHRLDSGDCRDLSKGKGKQ